MKNEKPIEVLFEGVDTNIFKKTNEFSKELVDEMKKIKGYILFNEYNKKTKITIYISGLKPDSIHGFHIHKAGDLRERCTSCCDHYNPFNKLHGGPNDKERHIIGNKMN